jgi:Rrf2 family protein
MPQGTRLSSQAIQEQMLVPRPFLIRIIADLSRAGLLMTFPGPNGGLELARPAKEINLRQIWEAIEGPLVISDCLVAPRDCALSSGCPVRCRWERLQKLMLAELESITMQELAEDALRIEAIKESGKLKRRVLVGAEVY